MKKTAKWIAICMVAIMALFAFGCDNGSSEPTTPNYDDFIGGNPDDDNPAGGNPIGGG